MTDETQQRWRMVTDDDGHNYMIPADRNEAWNRFCESEDYELGVVPSWAKPLNYHPSQYSFADWRYDRAD